MTRILSKVSQTDPLPPPHLIPFLFLPRESSSRYVLHPPLCNFVSALGCCPHAPLFPLPITQPLQVLETIVWGWQGAELGVFTSSLQQKWQEAYAFGLLLFSCSFKPFFSNKFLADSFIFHLAISWYILILVDEFICAV